MLICRKSFYSLGGLIKTTAAPPPCLLSKTNGVYYYLSFDIKLTERNKKKKKKTTNKAPFLAGISLCAVCVWIAFAYLHTAQSSRSLVMFYPICEVFFFFLHRWPYRSRYRSLMSFQTGGWGYSVNDVDLCFFFFFPISPDDVGFVFDPRPGHEAIVRTRNYFLSTSRIWGTRPAGTVVR